MNIKTESLSAIEGLEPKRLWRYFAEISSIPRESGNEAMIRDYVLSFATAHGIAARVDSTGNVILRKQASKGFEHLPSVALQGHLDMVCVKDEGVVHDFKKDPIVLKRDGDWLKAVGTSLGADNGIAIALIMDIFSDENLQHGPLEAILTITEETGLVGAFGLDPSLVQSRLMVNLDSEEEGIFYIGCAGGIEVDAKVHREYEGIPHGYVAWKMSVGGLIGGHSGAEIDKQRANAISCIARGLYALTEQTDVRLVSIDGGTKRNVIPSTCSALFYIPSKMTGQATKIIQKLQQDLAAEYAVSDPGLSLSLTAENGVSSLASSNDQSTAIIKALLVAPHGVDKMSMTIKGLVETSANLAIVKTDDSSFVFESSHRSSIQSSRDQIADKTAVAFSIAKGELHIGNGYPSWTPNPSSRLAQLCKAVWEKQYGTPAVITAIHAGLECGIINSLVSNMDSVSVGPNLRGVHSTAEACSVSSTAKVADFIRTLLVSL